MSDMMEVELNPRESALASGPILDPAISLLLDLFFVRSMPTWTPLPPTAEWSGSKVPPANGDGCFAT